MKNIVIVVLVLIACELKANPDTFLSKAGNTEELLPFSLTCNFDNADLILQAEMRLTEKEYEQFLRVHLKLMYYVAEREQLMPKKVSSFDDYMNLDIVEKIPSRDRIYERSEYIDEFVKENPYKLSSEDIEIAKGFNGFRKRQFWVVNFLKSYTVFLDEEYAYGVVAESVQLCVSRKITRFTL